MIKKLILIIVFAFCAYASNAQILYIFGGEDNKVYLGKFNAPPTDPDSIWNSYGEYGNKFNSDCIWNKFGDYGNKFNSYSPWNNYSSEAPILVDKDRKYYGMFQVSNKNSIVRKVCKLGTTIQDSSDLDLRDWYEILFED